MSHTQGTITASIWTPREIEEQIAELMKELNSLKWNQIFKKRSLGRQIYWLEYVRKVTE